MYDTTLDPISPDFDFTHFTQENAMTITTVAPAQTTAIVGTLDYDDLLSVAHQPDLFDEGRAFWIMGDGIVSVDLERVASMTDVLTKPRFVVRPDGWTRIHPNHYGVEVDDFEGRALPAQVAWQVLDTL